VQGGKGLATCPVCSRHVPHVLINTHLDFHCSGAEAPAQPSSSSAGQHAAAVAVCDDRGKGGAVEPGQAGEWGASGDGGDDAGASQPEAPRSAWSALMERMKQGAVDTDTFGVRTGLQARGPSAASPSGLSGDATPLAQGWHNGGSLSSPAPFLFCRAAVARALSRSWRRAKVSAEAVICSPPLSCHLVGTGRLRETSAGRLLTWFAYRSHRLVCHPGAEEERGATWDAAGARAAGQSTGSGEASGGATPVWTGTLAPSSNLEGHYVLEEFVSEAEEAALLEVRIERDSWERCSLGFRVGGSLLS
jgi:hypothetical protein